MSEQAVKFDPLDMRNYELKNLPVLPVGPWMMRFRHIGVPASILVFLFFHFQWCGTIGLFETQTKVAPAHCYSALAIFLSSLILWLSEAIPNYITSFLIIAAAVFTGIMKLRPAYAMLGEPVMVLNIASFIMASGLVATGLAKRISFYLVLSMGKSVSYMLIAFIALNLILGAFISATSAKTALLLPLFMVIAAIYGATGGENRNNVGRNLVLQNLLANNVSSSAFMTGSAANLVAVSMLVESGNPIYYEDWLLALFPLAVIQCAIAWWTGTRLIFPISKEDAKPKISGGMDFIRTEYDKLGPITNKEIRAGGIFIVVLLLWATGRLHGVSTHLIALCGAIAILLPSFSGLPRLGVISWNDTDIPWHMLMFSWGAYVLGKVLGLTDILGIWIRHIFDIWAIDSMPKAVVFFGMAALFGLTTLVSQSKTARTIIMFPILISIAQRMNWDVIGFCLPMAFLINQVYVLYFNSKPANISYLTNHYSSWESFKFGMIQLIIILGLLMLWAQYVMPLMGFASQLW